MMKRQVEIKSAWATERDGALGLPNDTMSTCLRRATLMACMPELGRTHIWVSMYPFESNWVSLSPNQAGFGPGQCWGRLTTYKYPWAPPQLGLDHVLDKILLLNCSKHSSWIRLAKSRHHILKIRKIPEKIPENYIFPEDSRSQKEEARGARGQAHTQGARPDPWPCRPVVWPPWPTSSLAPSRTSSSPKT
jgi:hypothetical protein